MPALTFTISPDVRFTKTVEDGSEQQELERFRLGQMQYEADWIEVDHGEWIRRDAIVSVRIASDEPMIAYG